MRNLPSVGPLRHAAYCAQRLDHASDLRGRGGLAEIISLHGGAAAFADEVELFNRLHTLRRGLDAEHRAEAGDGADDRHTLRAFTDRADEGAVDLDAVERKSAQIAQRRIADAEIVEIVEADAHPQRAELVQDL